MTAQHKSLEGIQILDLSLLLPGPYATHLLQSYGAAVTAIKPPHGDLLETVPPYSRSGDGHNCGVHFHFLHRYKTLLTLNLKTPVGISAIYALLEKTDILVEGFRPGVMARLGLDYATLRNRFPKLIYCSISGYGQTGPRSDEPGHDLNYLASSGFLAHYVDTTKTTHIPPLPFADLIGGALAAVQEILLALYRREKTGEGRYIDIAMAETFKTMLLSMSRFQTKETGDPNAPFLPFFFSPRYHLYQSQDGVWFALACIENKFWESFCTAVKRPDLLDPALYPGTAAAMSADPLLEAALADLFRSKSAQEWQDIAARTESCLTPVISYNDML